VYTTVCHLQRVSLPLILSICWCLLVLKEPRPQPPVSLILLQQGTLLVLPARSRNIRAAFTGCRDLLSLFKAFFDVNMKLELDSLGQIKNYVHMGQAVVLFLAWALQIAVLAQSGENDGRVGWYFGLVHASIAIQ